MISDKISVGSIQNLRFRFTLVPCSIGISNNASANKYRAPFTLPTPLSGLVESPRTEWPPSAFVGARKAASPQASGTSSRQQNRRGNGAYAKRTHNPSHSYTLWREFVRLQATGDGLHSRLAHNRGESRLARLGSGNPFLRLTPNQSRNRSRGARQNLPLP